MLWVTLQSCRLIEHITGVMEVDAGGPATGWTEVLVDLMMIYMVILSVDVMGDPTGDSTVDLVILIISTEGLLGMVRIDLGEDTLVTRQLSQVNVYRYLLKIFRNDIHVYIVERRYTLGNYTSYK